MKKSALLIAGLLAWGSTSMHADEGMWTLYNLPDAVYEQMVAEGFQLPCDMLYNSPDAISNYVVNFSGFCSGVVVSPDGLVFTNHHCGFSAINAHSTVEHDYMKDGFYARNYVEELPNENMFVSFMKNQQDITDRVNRLIAGKNAEQTEAAIDSLTNHMTDSVKAIDKTLHVTIDPFYEGNKYYATTYQDFPDVRLVFTCPRAWESSAVRRTTGCGRGRPATSPSSASMPTPRPTDRRPTQKTTYLTILLTGRR